MMKQKIIHLSVLTALGAFASAASAATSIDLYGTINLSVEKRGSNGVTMKAQDYEHASKIGIKGREDLGNGFAAIFKLEAQLNTDTGSGNYGSTGKEFGFSRESWVGLITPVGAFRFGRSTTPLVNMWIGGKFAPGRGIGQITGGLAGAGMRTTHPEAGIRWNNGLFYDVQKGGFTAGAAVTTKGSESVVPTGFFTGTTAALNTPINNEGSKGSKPAWGLYARYEGHIGENHTYKVGAAYQRDNGNSYTSNLTNTNAPGEGKYMWGMGAAYGYKNVMFTLGFAKTKIDNTRLPLVGPISGLQYNMRTGDSRTFVAAVDYKIDERNKVYASYGDYKRDNNYQFMLSPTFIPTAGGTVSGKQYNIGYEHALSKRTLVYANVRKMKAKNTCSSSNAGPYAAAVCKGVTDRVNAVLTTEVGYGWDVGISHSF